MTPDPTTPGLAEAVAEMKSAVANDWPGKVVAVVSMDSIRAVLTALANPAAIPAVAGLVEAAVAEENAACAKLCDEVKDRELVAMNALGRGSSTYNRASDAAYLAGKLGDDIRSRLFMLAVRKFFTKETPNAN